jgi:hypothetical protein
LSGESTTGYGSRSYWTGFQAGIRQVVVKRKSDRGATGTSPKGGDFPVTPIRSLID